MDYVADVKKYSDSVDEAVVEAMSKTYRLVLSRPDTAAIAFSDPEELERVKKNFLAKKLGLAASDEEFDAAIKEVGARMKESRRKSRLTVYYLLAERFGKLDALR